MPDVTEILDKIESGDLDASDRLLPLVYVELRQLAAHRLRKEAPGHTLQATALVHEAYVRLVDAEHQQKWDSRGHFFSAAAEAMRRILVESARRRSSLKRGGTLSREELVDSQIIAPTPEHELLALDEALDRLEETDAQASQFVKLRYFSGMTIPDAAEAMRISPRSANRLWAYAKAWLYAEIRK